jgi:hypothetical protein
MKEQNVFEIYADRQAAGVEDDRRDRQASKGMDVSV